MALDLNELREEHQRLESGQNDFLNNFVKMPEGEGVIVLRILPPRKGQKLYCVTRTHRLGQKNLHCPKTLVNGKWQGFCPICNYYNGLWKESDSKGPDEAEQLRTEARSIKPLERYYYNVIVRSQVNPSTGETETNVGPKIWNVGKQLHAKIIRAILGDPALQEEPLGDITDFETGRDFKIFKRIRKSGKDAFPNYDESKFVNPSVLGTQKQIAMWMENLHDLQALRMIKENSELDKELRIFRGLEKDPAVEFEYGASAKKPEVTVSASVTPKKSSVEDEDESLADDDFLNELRNM